MSATQNPKSQESRISSKAFDLLDCFVSGLDEVIYKSAENLARLRSPNDNFVQIEAEDIATAAEQVIAAIRERVRTGEIPKELGTEIDGMERCLNQKFRDARTGT